LRRCSKLLEEFQFSAELEIVCQQVRPVVLAKWGKNREAAVECRTRIDNLSACHRFEIDHPSIRTVATISRDVLALEGKAD